MPGCPRSFPAVADRHVPAGAAPLPQGLRLVSLRPHHGTAAAELMADTFLRGEPATRALASQEAGVAGVRRALGKVAGQMMRAAGSNGTSLAVVATDGTLAAVCASYQVGCGEPPAFPPPVAAIGALLGSLYEIPLPTGAAPDMLDVGILAVDGRFRRRGLATHLVQATAAHAAAVSFRTLTAGATSVSQDVFAACGFRSWGDIPYAGFQHEGTTPFAAVEPFSRSFPVPAAHLMGRHLRG